MAGLANGLNGEEKGGADVRAGEDATGDQEGVEDWSAEVQAVTGSVEMEHLQKLS